MNTVPFDFCRRVLETRNCCETRFCGCFCNEELSRAPKFAARNWNHPLTEKIHLSFHLSPVNGKWKYGFRNRDGWLTMEELKDFPHLENLRISVISVRESRNLTKQRLDKDVVDLEKLLNFVSFIANRPLLNQMEFKPNGGVTPEWEIVFKWLAEKWLSYISVGTLRVLNYPMEKRTREPFETRDLGLNLRLAKVLERRLMCGDLRFLRFPEVFGSSYSDGEYQFSKVAFERIIWNVLEAPRNYAKEKLDITAGFEESAESVLETAVQKKFCSVTKPFQGTLTFTRGRYEHADVRCRYVFAKAPKLLVDKLASGRWHLHHSC